MPPYKRGLAQWVQMGSTPTNQLTKTYKQMGYLTDGLTFNVLREANIARLPQFKNAKGEAAHSKKDGSDWCLAQWCNAVTGELGEAANIIKKVDRGDLTLAEAKPLLAKEFADIVTYLDILAMRAGIDLGKATMEKFNEVSIRVGSNVRVSADDWYYEYEVIHESSNKN